MNVVCRPDLRDKRPGTLSYWQKRMINILIAMLSIVERLSFE